MKKNIFKLFLPITALVVTLGCSEDFLDRKPQGTLNEETLPTEEGVNALLIGAYAMLDGYASENDNHVGMVGWASGSNWVMGDVYSDDAYKGQTAGWLEIEEMESFSISASNINLDEAWRLIYDGVSRANSALVFLEKAREDIAEQDAKQLEAEARFLRAWFHFQARIRWEYVPYITEDVDPVTVSNNVEVWDKIEADLQWGIDNNMDDTPEQVGRASLYACKAFKARVHLFQEEWTEARDLLDDVLEGPFSLTDHFYDNFSEEHENNNEGIFEIQYDVNEGARYHNARTDQLVNGPFGFNTLGYDYHRPSFDLFNAYKVDANGLPMFDTYKDNMLTEDYLIENTTPFTPTTHLLDPRVDWTIGRRGVMFLDWGPVTGSNMYSNSNNMPVYGPFFDKKAAYYRRNQEWVGTSTLGWTNGVNANNTRLIRLAAVKLWRAEVAVELNDLGTALEHVNDIRERANNNHLMGRVTDDVLGSPMDSVTIDPAQAAANYLINPYTSFANQDEARRAVRWEMRLELALEGFRFFDLVRWGIDKETMDGFVAAEASIRKDPESGDSYYQYQPYVEGKHDHMPLPLIQLDLQPGVLSQDPAYN